MAEFPNLTFLPFAPPPYPFPPHFPPPPPSPPPLPSPFHLLLLLLLFLILPEGGLCFSALGTSTNTVLP